MSTLLIKVKCDKSSILNDSAYLEMEVCKISL